MKRQRDLSMVWSTIFSPASLNCSERVASERLKRKFDETRTTALTLLSDDDPLKREAIRRSRYVKEVLWQGLEKRTKETLIPRIMAIDTQAQVYQTIKSCFLM